jgi:hypothetical protein
MQITKELIENDIRQSEATLENLKASMNQYIGAIAVLKNMLAYMDKEEPLPEEPSQEISAENKEVQDKIEEAMSMQELAEAVAGPGAVADEPVEFK